jgi:DNA (cytosine-5)-methyltransferase 1
MNFIDLFAGAGGLSEGFIRAGYTPIAHVEMDKAACYTLKTRIAYHYLKSIKKAEEYYRYLRGEIDRASLYQKVPAKLLESVINLPIGTEFNGTIFNIISEQLNNQQVDLIIGGPPCQAYSLVGRARSADGMVSDPRNHLYIQYAIYLEKYKPKLFVFENVLGLVSAKEGTYLERMETVFLEKGYQMKLYMLAANNFGVLQNRRRVIIIGWRTDLNLNLPELENIKMQSDFRVDCIFNDLPKLAAGKGVDKYSNYRAEINGYLAEKSIRSGIDILTQHVSRPNTKQDKEIYRIAVSKWNKYGQRLDYNDLPEVLKTHKNRHSFFDRFKIVAGDLNYSHTVVAHIAKDGHYYIHPDIEQNRSISVREAARLQSFPDNYYFEGMKEGQNRTAAFKQIGNAVPPLMAENIGNAINDIFLYKDGK